MIHCWGGLLQVCAAVEVKIISDYQSEKSSGTASQHSLFVSTFLARAALEQELSISSSQKSSGLGVLDIQPPANYDTDEEEDS